ncbi:unnamed protein product [Leuciscus chuanchicus]
MTSSVRCAPVPGGQSGPAERRWETLYSRSLARIPGEKRDTSRDSDYLTGIKRLRRLYCNVGIGFHLQVLPDGRITGVHNENRYSLLEISPVERGVVTLFGVRSGLFVAMNSKGKLYGSSSMTYHPVLEMYPLTTKQPTVSDSVTLLESVVARFQCLVVFSLCDGQTQERERSRSFGLRIPFLALPANTCTYCPSQSKDELAKEDHPNTIGPTALLSDFCTHRLTLKTPKLV